jgi:hypothetical protein
MHKSDKCPTLQPGSLGYAHRPHTLVSPQTALTRAQTIVPYLTPAVVSQLAAAADQKLPPRASLHMFKPTRRKGLYANRWPARKVGSGIHVSNTGTQGVPMDAPVCKVGHVPEPGKQPTRIQCENRTVSGRIGTAVVVSSSMSRRGRPWPTRKGQNWKHGITLAVTQFSLHRATWADARLSRFSIATRSGLVAK